MMRTEWHHSQEFRAGNCMNIGDCGKGISFVIWHSIGVHHLLFVSKFTLKMTREFLHVNHSRLAGPMKYLYIKGTGLAGL